MNVLNALNCILKNDYNGKFYAMYILLQQQQQQKKTNPQREQESRQQQHNFGSWKSHRLVADRPEKAQWKASSRESRREPSRFPPQNPSKAQEVCFFGTRGGIYCRGTGSPPPLPQRPLPCCGVTTDSHLCRNMEIYFLENVKSGDRVLSRWSEQTRGKTKRCHHNGMWLTAHPYLGAEPGPSQIRADKPLTPAPNLPSALWAPPLPHVQTNDYKMSEERKPLMQKRFKRKNRGEKKPLGENKLQGHKSL